jgi:Domain of unknown function (DUF4832)
MKALCYLTLTFTLLLITMCKSPIVEPVFVDKTVHVNFTEIDSILINPGVGYYSWISQEQAPVKSIDRYDRYNWIDLEKSIGKYDFSTLIKQAQSAYTDVDGRGKFTFAVRCVVEGIDHAYPSYLDANMDSWYSKVKKCWVPDWNNAYFLERLDSLVANLGRQFNTDVRIGAVEIRSYGNWGEWHLNEFELPVSPILVASLDTKKHMVDAYVNAFPNKQLIMMTDDAKTLSYAMHQTYVYRPIGLRRDSWGNVQMKSFKDSSAWIDAYDRWKIAPFIVEGYGTTGTGVTHSYCSNQIIDFHLSALSNGNFGIWNTLTSEQQNFMLQCPKIAGFRYVLRTVNYGDSLVIGQHNNFKSVWSNIGVAPTYNDWNVNFRLLDDTGKIIWEKVSVLSLRSLLPTFSFLTKQDVPVDVNDDFMLPSTLLPGSYSLEMIILDAQNYYSPLKIAIMGRKVNGAYSIGKLQLIKKIS